MPGAAPSATAPQSMGVERRNNPFDPRLLLGILIVGLFAFVALMYFLGAGETDDGRGDGAHGASVGLDGYAGLYRLLDAAGHDVRLGRTREAATGYGTILILTPPAFADPEEIDGLIRSHANKGPTILVLPKWDVTRLERNPLKGTKPGWVSPSGESYPYWLNSVDFFSKVELDYAEAEREPESGDRARRIIEDEEGNVLDDAPMPPVFGPQGYDLERKEGARWQVAGAGGALPKLGRTRYIVGRDLSPLVRDEDGRMLAAYFPVEGGDDRLADYAGGGSTVTALPEPEGDSSSEVEDRPTMMIAPLPANRREIEENGADADADETEETAEVESTTYYPDPYPVVIVAEPDLINNYGLANAANAELAISLMDVLGESGEEGEPMPVVFDLGLNGLGDSTNLLTLAFRPPFLAATIALLLALVVVGWRGFARFGPPQMDRREQGFGKRGLVESSSGFLRRVARGHLLTGRYEELMRGRIARRLALRPAQQSDEAIDAALARRLPSGQTFSHAAKTLRRAKGPQQTLKAARALKDIERNLSQ